jgi:hypothetical protein
VLGQVFFTKFSIVLAKHLFGGMNTTFGYIAKMKIIILII